MGYLLGIDDARNDISRTAWGEEAFEEEELEESVLMLTRLSRTSSRIIEGTISL